MKSSVELLWITPDPEEMIALTARVSSQYRENPDYTGLFRYLAVEIKGRFFCELNRLAAGVLRESHTLTV